MEQAIRLLRKTLMIEVVAMHSKPEAQHEWQPCPPGELERVAGRVRLRQRREALRKIGAAAAAATAAGLAGVGTVYWLSRDAMPHYGGLACNEVMPLLDDYHAGRLEPPLAGQVTLHLRKCPRCGPHYRRTYGVEIGVLRPRPRGRLA